MTPEETRRVFVEWTKPIQEHLNRYTDEEFIQAIDRSLESIERSAFEWLWRDKDEQRRNARRDE